MPTVSQLEYAIAVDTHRHFGRAAKACHVTQPTLSAQLMKLEEEINVVLFDRSVQPIRPTTEGVAVIAQARIVVSEFQKIKVIADGMEAEIAGTLVIGVIPTISSYLLPLFLESFAEEYPKLQIEIREMTTTSIIEALERELIDVGILALPIEAAGMDAITLFDEPFYLYVHSEHPLASRKQVTAKDMDPRDMWLLEEGHCFRNQVLAFCKLGGKREKSGNIRFESGSLETLKRLVARGVGYTLVPHLAAGEDDDRGDVAVIGFAAPQPAREVGLIFRRSQLKRRALDALAEQIKKNLPRSLVRAGKTVERIGIE